MAFFACSNGADDNTAVLAALLASKQQTQSNGGGQDSNPTTSPATTTPEPTTTPAPTETAPTTSTETPGGQTPAPAPAATYTITFNANDGSENPATATQTFTAGTPQALTPVEELGFSRIGFYFAGWGEAADAEQAAYSDGTQYVAAQDAALYALWSAMPVFSVKVMDSAGGVVTAAPATGFAGVEIELTAVPNAGYEFGSYAAVDAANNPISVTEGKFTMPQSAVFVTGVFSAINYNVVVGTAANGSVTASVQTATVGTEVALTASPDNGYKLAGLVVKDSNGVSVPTSEAEGSIKFTMPAQNVTVTATFAAVGHTITFNANDASESPATATQGFLHGVAAALKTVEELGFSKPGSYFAGWGLKADARSASYADGAGYICVEDKTLYALWSELPVYNVNTPVNSYGIVTANPATGYPGAEIAVKAEPNAGYALDSCAVADAAGNPIPLVDGKFTMPEGQVTVTANFKAINYMINVGSFKNGTVAANAATATVGTEVALDIAPNPGYFLESFAVMTDSGSPVNFSVADNARTFRMPAQNVTVTAVFSLITYRIDVGATENGSVVARAAAAAEGADVMLNIAPASGYALETLIVTAADGSLVSVSGTDNEKSFKMPAQSVTVSASFITIEMFKRSIPLTLEAIEAGAKVTFVNIYNYVTFRINDGDAQKFYGNLTVTLEHAGDKVAFYGGASGSQGWNDREYSEIRCDKDCYVYGNIMSLKDRDGNNFATADFVGGYRAFYRLFFNNTQIKNKDGAELLLPATQFWASNNVNSSSNCYEEMFHGCTGLTRAPELPATRLSSGCYYGMFKGCTGLTSAPELPATRLDSGCYAEMFSGCTGLTKAPDLPVTRLEDGCYCRMFEDCTSLTSGPKLTSTTLAQSCYAGMFSGCTNLTNAPELPATTLVGEYGGCYSGMFRGCTSLTRAPDLPATTLTRYCYKEMFSGCTSLTSAPELPVTKLAEYCYQGMFSGCTSLTAAPDLPAATLVKNCYAGMFKDCTSLASAPALSAVELAESCYSEMFSGCTGLTAAPDLPTATLAKSCYAGMFKDCTSLTSSPALPAYTLAESCYSEMFKNCEKLDSVACFATSISAADCTKDWLSGVADSGTFIRNPRIKECATAWTEGNSGIPSGWTVEDNGGSVKVLDNIKNGTVKSNWTICLGGKTVTLTITPEASYKLSSLVVKADDGEIIETSGTDRYKTFIMPAKNVTVSAEFVAINYKVTCGPFEHGSVVASASTAIKGQRVTLTINPDDGYLWDYLTANGTLLKRSGTENTVSFTMPASSVTVRVKFMKKEERPLTLEAIEASAVVTFVNNAADSVTYKINDGAENTIASGSTSNITLAKAGDKVAFYGGNATYAPNTSNFSNISCDKDCYVYGNIMSLIKSDGFESLNSLSGSYAFYKLFYNNIHIKNKNSEELLLPATTLTEACYSCMFKGCESLSEAPALPATTLANNCYGGMFNSCKSLTKAPELPATKLARNCYQGMLCFCGSLTNAPELPATTLADRCYEAMFKSCTKLSKAPALPATTLAGSCYAEMFSSTSLTNAPDLPATTLAENCYQGMFKNCTKLTKAPALSAPALAKSCYMEMFSGCTFLTSAPALSATTLAESCCEKMFSGCSRLTSVPALPATALAKSCYESMFSGCTSLAKAPSLPATKLASQCYFEMFYGCTSLSKASELPATTLAYSCYAGMFCGCKSLASAPELPATTLADSCYNIMFADCTSLTSAPALPATTLADACYTCMFQGCTSLTSAPKLPAKTLTEMCYYFMFSGCTKLNSVTCLATDISAQMCTYYWLHGVSSYGSFTKASNMAKWIRGEEGVPKDWVVYNY